MRELKQNASAVVAEAAAGEEITITVRGQAVARLLPIAQSGLEGHVASGRVRPPTASLATLPAAMPLEDGPSLSETLDELRRER